MRYENTVKSLLSALRKRLLYQPANPSDCTRFSELATRMQNENVSLNLVLTDGYADCPDEHGASVTRY